MPTDKPTFADLVNAALADRGMIPADLARETKMDSGAISNILKGRRSPSIDTCKLIAKALNLPLEVVYRWADYLPENKDADPITEEVVHLMSELDASEKTNVLQYTTLRHQVFTERQAKHQKARIRPRPATS